jgi:hypothetical protein
MPEASPVTVYVPDEAPAGIVKLAGMLTVFGCTF